MNANYEGTSLEVRKLEGKWRIIMDNFIAIGPYDSKAECSKAFDGIVDAYRTGQWIELPMAIRFIPPIR